MKERRIEMGQINDWKYEIEGVTFGNKTGNPKKKILKFRINVDVANKTDGMLLQLLDDRHLYLAVDEQNNSKPIKVGKCAVLNWGGNAAKGTSFYIFEMKSIDWLPDKYQEERWSGDKVVKLIVIDMTLAPEIQTTTEVTEAKQDDEEETEELIQQPLM